MRIVLNSEFAPNEVLDHRRVPASRGIAAVLWTPFDPRGELLPLSFGEFARSSRRRFVNQAGHALEEVLISVIANGLLTESQHVGDFAHALPLSQGQQSVDAFDQFQRAAGISLLEASIKLFAGERAEL